MSLTNFVEITQFGSNKNDLVLKVKIHLFELFWLYTFSSFTEKKNLRKLTILNIQRLYNLFNYLVFCFCLIHWNYTVAEQKEAMKNKTPSKRRKIYSLIDSIKWSRLNNKLAVRILAFLFCKAKNDKCKHVKKKIFSMHPKINSFELTQNNGYRWKKINLIALNRSPLYPDLLCTMCFFLFLSVFLVSFEFLCKFTIRITNKMCLKIYFWRYNRSNVFFSNEFRYLHTIFIKSDQILIKFKANKKQDNCA